MAKKATTLHDNLGNDLLPVTNASITFMDDGNSVQAEIQDLKEKTQYNKGHYTTEQDLLTAYPNDIENPQVRKGWYAIIGQTDTVWIWDIEGDKWVDSGVSSGGVESVNGLDGEVILTGGNINATATINDTSKTEVINKHLTDIYSELDNKVDLDGPETITGKKKFQTNEEYGFVPNASLIINNNYNGGEREVGLTTKDNMELVMTSENPDGTGQTFMGEISLNAKHLLFADIDESGNPTKAEGIEFTNGELYKTVATPDTYEQNKIITEKDYATSDKAGVIKSSSYGGVEVGSNGVAYISPASNSNIDAKTQGVNKPIVPANLDYAVKVGITTNTQTLTEEEKTSAKEWLGIEEPDLTDYVKDTDFATTEKGGVLKLGPTATGLQYDASGYLKIMRASETDITNKTDFYKPIVPAYLDHAVKVGMTTNEENWTDEEKASARELIGATNESYVDDLGNTKQDKLSSTQLEAVNSGANTTNIAQITTNSNNINTIDSKIPTQASSTNQLADKDFVNSSLNSITAFYITSNTDGDPFPTKSALLNATTYYSGGQVRVPTRNDYAIVLEDESEDNATTRYIYYNQWEYQYTVNETALTANQLSAINSGITSTLVGKISSNEQMINSLSEQVANDYVPETRTINNKPLSNNITLNANDVGALPDTTTIPTVNNGTLTIQQNGASVGTFTANQRENVTVDITTPTDYVPDTRTINGKSLSSNITLNAGDVGALPSTTVIPDISGLATQSSLETTNANVENLTTRVTTNETNITNLQNHKVDKTTKINNKALNSDITLNASDVGALPSDTPVITYGENISPNADEYNTNLLLLLLDNTGNENGLVLLNSDSSVDLAGRNGTHVSLANALTGDSIKITNESKLIVNEYEIALPKKAGTVALTDDIPDTSSFIDKNVNNLTNYTNNSELNNLLSQKQNNITSSNKLSSTLISGLGTASTVNTGTSSGNVPVLGSDGKLPSSVVPATAITDTFVVNSDSAQLALTAQVGDVCVRTDLNRSYILKAEPASNVNNWQELLTPTDTVTSVNGQKGDVVLDATSVGAVPNNTAFYVKSVNGQTGTVTGLATNDVATTSKAGLMSISDKTKLNGIASGAEVNVQSDWNEASSTSDAYIKNKPSVPAKYDATKTYKSGDMVLYVNRIFEYRYSTPSAGNAPPTAEAEQSNTYWISTNAYKAQKVFIGEITGDTKSNQSPLVFRSSNTSYGDTLYRSSKVYVDTDFKLHDSGGEVANTSQIKTNLSDLTQDSTHRTVTDSQISSWNAKSNFSGDYNDLTNKPTIPTIPTNLVTTDTEQTISGAKTFSSTVKSTGGFSRDGTAVFDAKGTNEFYMLTSVGGPAYINFAGSGISGKTSSGTYYFGDGTGTPGQTSGKIYCGDVYVDNGSTQVARKTDLGTQATYSLSGTTLTITPK